MTIQEPGDHDHPLLPIQPPTENDTHCEPNIAHNNINGNSHVLSKWGGNRKTIFTMISFYVLALITALVHLGMFLRLDKRLVNEKGIPSQAYIATISTLLVNIFGTSLGVSLGIASTQYVWHLFRVRPMTVQNIEYILRVRQDPSLLLRLSIWSNAPIVCVLAVVILLLAVAKAFPPGALTVTSRNFFTENRVVVPAFAANDTVNYNTLCENGILTSMWTCITRNPIANRIAYATLATGEVLPSSVCGSNCSYDIAFEGPQLKCNKGIAVTLQNRMPENYMYQYYSGGIPGYSEQSIIPREGSNGKAVYPSFFVNISSPIGWAPSLVTNKTYLECQPEIVTYELHVDFENGARNLSLSKRNDARSLTDLYVPYLTPEWANSSLWSSEEVDTLTATNIYAIIASFIKPLSGIYPMESYGLPDHNDTITLENGTTIMYEVGAYPVFQFTHGITLEAMNGTIVDKTYLNKNRNNFSLSVIPEIEASATILNEALANVTLSILFTLPFWNTTVTATQATSHNFYSFSNPIYLLVPYGASLIITLPFLVLGMIALRRNGVAAMDGGWLQVLMATTGSQRLRTEAAGGCLGGEDNIPKELKKMQVVFGEITQPNENDSTTSPKAKVRRAGFGLTDEVVPLNRRVKYGLSSK